MVGEPLLRMGEDFMGVKLPVEIDPPRVGGLGLDGRGCASKYRTTDSRGLRSTGFGCEGFFDLSGTLRTHSALMAAVLTGR